MNVRRKTIMILALLVGVALLAPSCKKKEGCTDPNSSNYDPDAEKDDGSCQYDTGGNTGSGDNFFITDVTISGTDYKKIEGTFNRDYTLTSNINWLLSGGVFVDDGATLSIEAGTMIYAADDGTTPFLSILQGGNINASGTSSNPIVFTSVKSSPQPGDWGGIIVNGYANINVGATAQGEGGTGTYGGSDDNDDSGIIRYVRVEYAGKILGTDNELNGFSFNGVGAGTTIEYIQAYRGTDDGIEFFGGTVSVKYAVSSGNHDDSFDWTHGWRGNGQFWVVHQNNDGGDRGIEADNNGDDNFLTPYSEPTLSNLTIVGNDDGDSENTGMRLRAGTKGKIYNAIVVNFPANGIRVSDQSSTDHMTNGTLVVKNSVVFNNGTNWKDCAVFENDATNAITDPGLVGYVGTVNTNSLDPTTLGAWFSTGNFIGAVESGNDWTAGWTVGL